MYNGYSMSKIVLIQGSLNPKSKTAIVINAVEDKLQNHNIEFETIDLREINMEFVDGRPIGEYNDSMQKAITCMRSADAYVIGMPVYQYSVSGPLKNFIDIVTETMNEKPFGIVSNSGGVRSYLAASDLMIMLSFEAWALPIQPIVHTWAGDFEGQEINNKKVGEKIEKMLDNLQKYSK